MTYNHDMQVRREQWKYGSGERVWVGRYRNSQNLPHWHYECELLYVDRGTLDMLCGETRFRIGKGQTFYVGSETVHYHHALSPDTEVTMIVFDYDIIEPFAKHKRIASPVLSGSYDIHKTYDILKTEIGEKKPFFEYFAAVYVAELMLEIFRNEKVTQDSLSNSGDRFKALLTDMAENFADYDLESAAKFMNMNSSYFSRLFHELMGLTFTQYLTYIRCAHAVTLLHSDRDLSTTEIANICGFMTIRNFNRLFKDYTGYTPTGLPRDFVMAGNRIMHSDTVKAPTLNECVLLESSAD